jgi:hypothetical protein
MKLQVNTSGAWKTVCDFTVSYCETVRSNARMLALASCDIHLSFRIMDEDRCLARLRKLHGTVGEWESTE